MALNISPFQFSYRGLSQGAPKPQQPVWGPPDMAKQLEEGIGGILPALAEAYKGTNRHMQNQIAGDAIGRTPAAQATALGQQGGPYAPAPAAAPNASSLPPVNAPEDIKKLIVAKATAAGLDPDFMLRSADIESKFDPRAYNGGSKAAGLFQFVPGTWAEYGQGSPFVVENNVDAAVKLAVANREKLRAALQREPTSGELYLAHQQGAGGAIELLKDPNRLAVDATERRNLYSNLSDDERQRVDTMTAGQFANKWTGKFGEKMAGAGPQPAVVGEPLPPQVAQPPGAPQPQAALPPQAAPQQQAAVGPQGNGPIPLQQPQQPRNAQPLFSTAQDQSVQMAAAQPFAPTNNGTDAAPTPMMQPQQQAPQMVQAPLPPVRPPGLGDAPPPQAAPPAPAVAPPPQPGPAQAPPQQVPPQAPAPPPQAGGGAGGAQGIPASAQALAQIDPNFRLALSAAIKGGDPSMVQAIVNAGDKLMGGGADYHYFTGPDGGQYRINKRGGPAERVLAGRAGGQGDTIIGPGDADARRAANIPQNDNRAWRKSVDDKGNTKYEPISAPDDPNEKIYVRENNLREKFEGDKQISKYRESYSSFNQLRKSAEEGNGVGDVALIFQYMKMLDPDSAVREGEFALAGQTQNIPDQWRNLYNRALTGERLSDKQRAQFVNLAGKTLESRSREVSGRIDFTNKIAKEQGVKPENVTGGVPLHKFEYWKPPEGRDDKGGKDPSIKYTGPGSTPREPVRVKDEADINSMPPGRWWIRRANPPNSPAELIEIPE